MTSCGNYSIRDWEGLSRGWPIEAYLAYPGGDVLVEKPGAALTCPEAPPMTWDEATEEILERRAGAWQRLADL